MSANALEGDGSLANGSPETRLMVPPRPVQVFASPVGRRGAFADWWSPKTGLPGPGAPWWGVRRGLCCFSGPLPAGGLARRKPSVGVRVQARTPCRMPPHQPAGIAKRAVWFGGSPQRWCRKGDVRCVPRFLTGMPPAARGLRPPLTPRLPWHVGFERSSRAGKNAVRDSGQAIPFLVDRPPSSECRASRRKAPFLDSARWIGPHSQRSPRSGDRRERGTG